MPSLSLALPFPLILILSILIIIVYYFITSRHGITLRRKDRNAPSKYDLKAITVDTRTNSVKTYYLERLGSMKYYAINSDEPLYLVELPNMRVYDENGEKVVFARRYSILLIPLDPEIESSISIMQNVEEEELASPARDDAYSFIGKMINLQGKRYGRVVVPGYGHVAFTFKPTDISSKLLEATMESGLVTVNRTIAGVGEIEEHTKLIKAKTEYEQAKMSWLRWVAILIMTSALALFLIMQGIGR